MKYIFLIGTLLFVGCTTTSQNCPCKHVAQGYSNLLNENSSAPIVGALSPSQIIDLATKFLNDDNPEDALKVLDNMPSDNRTVQYKKLKHEALSKFVMNMRYKVRVLYEKSLQLDRDSKQDLLFECKKTLEAIVKNYPEYDDMYSVKNNLKQIDRELAKKYDARR